MWTNRVLVNEVYGDSQLVLMQVVDYSGLLGRSSLLGTGFVLNHRFVRPEAPSLERRFNWFIVYKHGINGI